MKPKKDDRRKSGAYTMMHNAYLGTADRMPTLDPGKPKYRTTSGTDERGITIQPATEDKIPEVPIFKRKKRI